MKKLLQTLLLLPLFMLGACGGGGADGESGGDKSLFSTWTEEGTGFVMSLDGGTFDTWQNFIVTDGTYTCNSRVKLVGNDSSGSFYQTSFSGDCAIVLKDSNGNSSSFSLISTDRISGDYSNNGTNLVIRTTVVGYLESGSYKYITLYHPIVKTYK